MTLDAEKRLMLDQLQMLKINKLQEPLKTYLWIVYCSSEKSIVEQRKFQEVLTGLIKLEVKQEVVISPGRSC